RESMAQHVEAMVGFMDAGGYPLRGYPGARAWKSGNSHSEFKNNSEAPPINRLRGLWIPAQRE
ncbi:hypothetical protein AB0M94_39470, partial [Streptomyces xanthochromogenes]|uniref:hypothetical protein n=1 Tax=Streptomyces xanthochromogenes TaxID=67384 RepID=UPI003427DAA7